MTALWRLLRAWWTGPPCDYWSDGLHRFEPYAAPCQGAGEACECGRGWER